MEVNRDLSEWVWNNVHIDDMQKAKIVPHIRGKEETIAQLEAENEQRGATIDSQQIWHDKLKAENERLRKLINKHHLGIMKVDDGHEINLGGES